MIVAIEAVPLDVKKEGDVKKVENLKSLENGASKSKTHPSKEGAAHHGKEDSSAAAATEKPVQPAEQPSMFWGAMTAIGNNFEKFIASIQTMFSSASATGAPAATAAPAPAAAGTDTKKEKLPSIGENNSKVHVAEGVAAKEHSLQKKEGAHPQFIN